jgi:hypothetical protein
MFPIKNDTPQGTICICPFAICIMHYTLCIMHNALYNVHCALCRTKFIKNKCNIVSYYFYHCKLHLTWHNLYLFFVCIHMSAYKSEFCLMAVSLYGVLKTICCFFANWAGRADSEDKCLCETVNTNKRTQIKSWN